MVRPRSSEAGPLTNTRGATGRGIIGRKRDTTTANVKGGFDGPMTAPWRKTVSIFHNPVTRVHTTSKDTKQAPVDELRKAGAHLRVDKPKQVFWAKHLEGLCAMVPVRRDILYPDSESLIDHIPETLTLASRLEPVVSISGPEATAASLCSALQNAACHPVMGQTSAKKQLDANAAVFVNPDQPMIQGILITDADVTAQEQRVLDARGRLAKAREHFGSRKVHGNHN